MSKRQKTSHAIRKDESGTKPALFAIASEAPPGHLSDDSPMSTEADHLVDQPLQDPDQHSDTEADASQDSEGSESDQEQQTPPFDTVKAKSRLHQGTKSIRSAAKTAKAFELQRLLKKLRQARRKSTDPHAAPAHLEREIDAVKHFDTHLLAARALTAKMVKNKLLPRPTARLDPVGALQRFPFAALVEAEPLLAEDGCRRGGANMDGSDRKDRDALQGKVLAMLTSSKKLADEVNRVVGQLKVLAGLEANVESKAGGTERAIGGMVDEDLEDGDESEEEEEDKDEDEEEDEDKDEDERDSSDSDVEGSQDGSEPTSADEEELERLGKQKLAALGDLSQWDDLLGSDSDAEAEGPSQTQRSSRKRRRRRSDSLSQSEYGSDEQGSEGERISDPDEGFESDVGGSGSASDSDDSEDDGSDSASAPSTRGRRSSKANKGNASSSFLPSLSTGFIGGRSDDDWSDAEADLADRDLSELKSGKKKRESKNRMGQRARKALYEKKYGRNANHVKLREREKRKARDRPASGGDSAGMRAVYGQGERGSGWGTSRTALPSQETSAPRLESGVETRRTRGGGPRVARPSASSLVTASVRRSAPATAATFEPAGPAPGSASLNRSGPAQSTKREGKAQGREEMHPSWIAKQRQKELAASVKPAGTKITFD